LILTGSRSRGAAFATAIGVADLTSWRRKQKSAAGIAAAGLKHLIGFRSDRHEAVFLFAMPIHRFKFRVY
jgi:hypothetical protein